MGMLARMASQNQWPRSDVPVRGVRWSKRKRGRQTITLPISSASNSPEGTLTAASFRSG